MRSLTDILNGVERNLAWPSQSLPVIMGILGKPDGGERAIGLTGGLYRLWSRLRKPLTQAWEADRAEEAFWDKAIKGNSALLAAIVRETKSEVTNAMGLEAAEVLFDAAKFFDTLVPELVCKFAVEQRFPVLPLYLGMLVHRAVRYFSSREGLSGPVHPGVSILAGCTQSVAWTRGFLHKVLSWTHSRFPPAKVESWVDDLHLRVQGTMARVKAVAAEAAIFIIQQLHSQMIVISPKSLVLATKPEIRDFVIAQVKRRTGVELQAKKVGRDLGTDSTMAKLRRLPTFKLRFGKGMRRLSRTRGLVKVAPAARWLALTGGRAHMAWGHQAKGLSPTALRSAKAGIAKASGCHRQGGCTTTAIALQ